MIIQILKNIVIQEFNILLLELSFKDLDFRISGRRLLNSITIGPFLVSLKIKKMKEI